MSEQVSTSLYRHFASDGTLLYVGISLSWPARTKSHARDSRWFDQVARVEIERFESREAALDAERQAIISERPKFNIVHNRPEAARARRPAGASQSAWQHPILQTIAGHDVIVGPPKVYSEEMVSVMVAHGALGSPGDLVEVQLGILTPSVSDEWMQACATVLEVREPGHVTIEQAGEDRQWMINLLRDAGRCVQAFDTELSMAVAYASTFPSEKSRKVLDDMALERAKP